MHKIIIITLKYGDRNYKQTLLTLIKLLLKDCSNIKNCLTKKQPCKSFKLMKNLTKEKQGHATNCSRQNKMFH